jgi:hypothetical protein
MSGMGTLLALPATRCQAGLVANPRPALELVVVKRQTAAVTSKDQHPGADQLIADVGGWAGIPGAIPGVGNVGESATASNSS